MDTLKQDHTQEILRLREIVEDAVELIAEIMRDEVNTQDECEKWLRAYAPQHLFQKNAERTHGRKPVV